MQRNPFTPGLAAAVLLSFAVTMILDSSAFAEQTVDELRSAGAFGFPVATAVTHCNDDQLRVQSWSSDQYFVVQAILWNDGDDELGETSDGRPVGDTASLVLDVNLDKRSTPEVDRTYSLNPWPTSPGLRYTIPYKGGAQSHILGDSTGRGSIRYITVAENKKVRVDTFVIPLAELDLKVDQEIGVAYLGKSTVPAITVNSVGYTTDREQYYAFNLPGKTFKAVTLKVGSENFDPLKVPEGREDQAQVAKPKKKPTIKVGAVPPEFVAGDWLNAETPPTLAALQGKVVLVDFWATWCGPCVAGIPHLNQLAEKHAEGGLRIVAFTDQSRKGIAKFQQTTEMNYPVGCASELAAEYGVSGLPHTFLIGRDGTLLWEGNPADDGFDDRISEALAAAAHAAVKPTDQADSGEPAKRQKQKKQKQGRLPPDPGKEYVAFTGLDQVIDDSLIHGALYHRHQEMFADSEEGMRPIPVNRIPKSIAEEFPTETAGTASSVEDLMRSTVIIAGGDDELFIAGAVMISSDGLAVTNYHVAELGDQKMVGMTSDGKLHRLLEVVAGDRQRDVAIIRLEGSDFMPAKIASSPVPVGSQIEIIHHSDERFYTYDRGHVMRYSMGGGEPRMEISAPYGPGGSGCGIFNERHELVGLVSKLQMGQGPAIASGKVFRHVEEIESGQFYTGGYPQLVVKQAVPLSAIRMLWTGSLDVKTKTSTPGETIFVDFPELGNTWGDKPARAGIYFPTDYSPDKKFPLLVWFGGGAGSDSPARPIAITNGKGFICVALPYRSEVSPRDGESDHESEGESQPGGWQSPWPWYQTMLDKVESIVPNIDSDRRIAGGSSSGGAAILFQLGNSEGAFQDYFYGFVPTSAGWPMGGLDSIAGRPMLAVVGEKDKRLPNFQTLETEANAAGVDFQLKVIEGAGHKTPESVFPEIHQWMIKNVVERDTTAKDADAVAPESKSMPKEASDTDEAASPATPPIEMKILFVGAASERSQDYVSFLQRNFSSVDRVDSSQLTEDQMNACDVMVIDQTVTTLPFGNTKACVMISSAAANTGQHYGSKIDWLCLCLANEAYFVNTEHPIFHEHFNVMPTLTHKKCKYTTLMIDAWKVEEPQDGPGLVSSRRYFEHAADSEIISGGVNMKGISGVPLVREANRFLWGFAAPPSEMTEEARQVFVNAVAWMKKFDGETQTEYRGLHPRSTYQSVLASPYVEKQNLGKWFSAELLHELDYDKKAIEKLFTENLDYVTIPVGHGQLEIDEDAKRLKTPNSQVASLDTWTKMLDSGEDAETALRLLQRYTGLEFTTADQWKNWLRKNREQLIFDETSGYQFRIKEHTDKSGNSKIVKALDTQASPVSPSSVAPAIFDIALVGLDDINGVIYARAGSKITIAVRANILSPWHIYAPDSDNGVNISTQIDVELPDGMQFAGEWKYPQAENGQLGDGAMFTRQIKLSKTVSGNSVVVGVVNFQACTQQRCQRPQKLKFELPLTAYAFEQ